MSTSHDTDTTSSKNRPVTDIGAPDHFTLTDDQRKRFRCRLYGITLLSSTPSYFSQNVADKADGTIREWLKNAGVDQAADQNICLGFIKAINADDAVSAATKQLRESLRSSFGVDPNAVYPQNACPNDIDSANIMKSMAALDANQP